MPQNPSQHVPLGRTVPTVQVVHQLQAELHQQQQKLLAIAAAPSTVAQTLCSSEASQSSALPSTVGSTDSASEHGEEVAEGDANDAAAANMNTSVMGAPCSSSGAVGGKCSCGADSNKLNLRLKEMFKERITSFREGVYLLTGFKVNGIVTVVPHSHAIHYLKYCFLICTGGSASYRGQWIASSAPAVHVRRETRRLSHVPGKTLVLMLQQSVGYTSSPFDLRALHVALYTKHFKCILTILTALCHSCGAMLLSCWILSSRLAWAPSTCTTSQSATQCLLSSPASPWSSSIISHSWVRGPVLSPACMWSCLKL